MNRFKLALLALAVMVIADVTGFSVSNVGQIAQAQEEKPAKTRRVPTISERTYKRLSVVQEFVDAKDYNGAIAEAQDLLTGRNMNGNEIGQIQNLLGFAYFSKEDYRGAIRSYEAILAQGDAVPEGLEVSTIYTLAQLYAVQDDFKRALDKMRLWLTKANNPGADPYVFMSQLEYQDKNYRSATQLLEKAIGIAKERNVPIKENWWGLLNFLYYEQENYPKVIEILEILVREFPKRQYWVQLAGMYGQRGDDKKQLHAMEAAFTAGMLSQPTDFVNLSGLLMQEEVPYRAAKILEDAMKDKGVERSSRNLQSLGQAWQMSQEVDKAIPVFEEAGRKADDGKIYERLASLYLDKDNYDKCVAAADNALNKGGLRRSQQVLVVKGMCQYNDDKLSSARTTFTRARDIARRAEDDTTLRMTQQWISFINREADRREQLANAI